MASTQDGLGRVARKRGIEGHGTQEIIYLCGNGQTYYEFRKKAPKQRISLVAYRTSKSQGFSGSSRDPDSPRSKLFLLSREVLPQFQSPLGTT